MTFLSLALSTNVYARARASVNSPLVSSTSFLMWLLHIDSLVHWLNIQSCLSIYKRFKNKTFNEHTQMVCHLVYSCFGMTSSKSWMFFFFFFSFSLSFYLSSTHSWNVCVFMCSLSIRFIYWVKSWEQKK